MKVLIVKLSSMGDLIHTFPALTDTAKHNPNIEYHWLVEESFQEIPHWHFNVTKVIPIGLRRWRRERWRCLLDGEFKKTIKKIREEQYDLVIDAQSSIKSAILTRFARGTRCGFSFMTTRERFASLFYQKTFSVIFEQHAIRRLRLLFSKIFNYPFEDDQPTYGMDIKKLKPSPIDLPNQFLVFLHNTSWVTKLYPENYWRQLIRKVKATGYTVLLPWHNQAEKARALRLAKDFTHAQVLPKTQLSEIADIIRHAKACVCCDTGLGHVAAALDVPSISLYGPTNPEWIRAIGHHQIHLSANFSCAPCYQKQCTYKGKSEEKPACFTTIPPERVWEHLESFL